MENEEIEPIRPIPLPFSLDDKIFKCVDEEGNIIGKDYSYNDWLKKLESISGVNKELCNGE